MNTSTFVAKTGDDVSFTGGANGSSAIVEYNPVSRTPRIGLALSCGGARGLAHIGVIQVLEENHIPIVAVSGTSMGSYVGSLWAYGLNGKELEELASEFRRRWDFLKLLDPVMPPFQGLFHGCKIKRHYQRTIGDTTFDQLKIPFYTVATDVDSYEGRIFHEGVVADAVHASCCIPGACAPVEMNGHRYVDGGVVDPLPVRVLRDREELDAVIAVSVVPGLEENRLTLEMVRRTQSKTPVWSRALSKVNRHVNPLAEGNAFDTLRNCISAAQVRLEVESARLATLLLRPVLVDPQFHDYFRFQKYIELGRKIAEENLPALLALTQPSTKEITRHEPVASHLEMGRCA